MSMRRWGAVGSVVAVTVAAMAVGPPAAAAGPEVITAIASAAPGFANANAATGSVLLASDGRFVAFTSKASNLVAGATAGVERVYLRDLLTDTTTLVSRTSAGQPNQSAALLGAISRTGDYVAFSTTQPLVPSDTNGKGDVYLWKRATNTIELVSLTTADVPANGDSGTANGDHKLDISDDGRYVFFSSTATNMNPTADLNGVADVFRRDRTTGTTTLVSVNGAAQANGASSQVDASGNGRFVAFATLASNFPGTDTNGVADVWFRDMDATTIEKVSVGHSANPNGESRQPSISDDGDFVVFQSSASNLLNGIDTNSSPDVFFRRRSSSFTNRLSTTSGGDQLPSGATNPSMSPDGTRTAFQTSSPAIFSDANGTTDVYLRESGVNRLVSVRSDGAQSQVPSLRPSVAVDRVAWVSEDRSAPTDTNDFADAFVRMTPLLGPFDSIDEFVPFQLQRITGVAPTTAQTAETRRRLRSGASPQRWVMDQVDAPSFSATRAPVIRLYWAYFKRRPDLGGLNFWINRYRAGTRLVEISQAFSRSSEFQSKYGNTTPEQFVTLVYQNVLERNPDSGGLAFWANKIRQGTPRGQVMTNFSESSEGSRKIGPRSDAILVALGMYGKIPSATLFTTIVADRLAGLPREITVTRILQSAEYGSTT